MPPESDQQRSSHSKEMPKDEWTGPWGAIEPVPQSVEILCLQIEAEIGKPIVHYFPYRTITKWCWIMDAPETLEIHFGGTKVTISGEGLRRLAEALNVGQLRLVCDAKGQANDGIRIGAIRLDD